MAATYPALPPQAAVSDGTVGPGETFVFRGQGFHAGESLTITVTPGNPPAASGANISGGRSVASKINVVLAAQTFNTTADAQGAFSFPLTISTAGTYSITATGTSGITVGPVTVVVDPSFASSGAPLSASVAGPTLPNTGADSGLVLWTIVGAGALAAGAASVVVVRRRAKNEAAA
jgi:LPXTG-motif cell wall-anchored protein